MDKNNKESIEMQEQIFQIEALGHSFNLFTVASCLVLIGAVTMSVITAVNSQIDP